MINGESYSINYSNIVFSCLANNETLCYQREDSHTLMCIYSGEISICLDGREIFIASAGDVIFIRRNHRISFLKRPANGKHHQSISIVFDRDFLRQYYKTLDSKFIPQNSNSFESIVTRLPSTPYIESIFASMLPFFNTAAEPLEEVINLRLQETILTLLKTDNHFFSTLFDFTDSWKIDILDFLNKNYMYELTIEEIASFTGRSLATFKRDFKKISDLTPQKWIIKKRLETAFEKLTKENKNISEVYANVGFKNHSHFTTLFKKYYGYTPANVKNKCSTK